MALGRLSKGFRSILNESSKDVLCGFLHSGWRKSCLQAKRHLLTEDVIKLQVFQQQKLELARLITGREAHFIERFRTKLERKDMIVQEELKILLYLCQTPDDVVVARDAIYRYHSENSHGDFKFGPLFMRLCYELSLEKMATAAITDTTLKGFFSDCTSFNIVLDMLFLKGAYEDALEVLRTMKIYGIQFSKETLILAFGTFYKLNTPESYKACTSLLEEIQTKKLIPRHAYYFAIALALRQDDTEMAQHLFSKINAKDRRLYKNLQVLTLAKSGKFKDVTLILAAILQQTSAFIRKYGFSEEVVNFLREQCKSGPHETKINRLLSQIEEAGQVTQLTLDDLLCHTPAGKRKPLHILDYTRNSQRTLKRLTSTLLYE